VVHDEEARIGAVATRCNEQVGSIIALAERLHKIESRRRDRTGLESLRDISAVSSLVVFPILEQDLVVGAGSRK